MDFGKERELENAGIIPVDFRLMDEGERREVLEDAKKIASSADKEQIELDIAVLYEQEGNDDEALSRYEALSKRLGASHWMQRELSSRIIEIHRRKGNIAELAKVLETQWKSPSYQQHLELANLYEETSNPDKALEHLKKAISSSLSFSQKILC